MERVRTVFLFTVLALAMGCSDKQDPCSRFFRPYPDTVSGRFRTDRNGPFLDAMAAYSRGDHATAAAQLKAYVDQDRSAEDAVRLYLACSYLAIGKPYDAELQLDFLEKSPLKGFNDEVDWYNALCWTCSGQYGRAVEQCDRIIAAKVHARKVDAEALKKALQRS